VEWQPEHGPVHIDPTLALGDRDELDRGLQRLTADQRTVLVLRYYVGLADRQVAEVMRLPVGTVKSRTARAISALRAELEAEARTVSMVERVR
jgi:RNA polymerase sigma factor (sigma-70 family)